MPHLSLRRLIPVLLFTWLLTPLPAAAQTTAFTYQGKLSDGGAPASGSYDFQFSLYDTAALGTGTQFGTTQTLTSVAVSAGIFSVELDFGACPACFNGAARFLEIALRPTGGGSFTTLGPRQPLSSTPYAIRSLNAAAADGLSVACVNCVTSSQIASVSGSAVSGTIPVASVPAGSDSYIQNTTSQQATSNFNISGSGTAAGTLSGSVVNAATQFNLGGSRILSVPPGSSNLFAGFNAGLANTTGNHNAYFGYEAGSANTTGSVNSFFGNQAGYSNTTGISNAFFGEAAGYSNTTGIGNAFFGKNAGSANTTGIGNAFFGKNAGSANTTGFYNAFFGPYAGYSNTTGQRNTFIGYDADFNIYNPTGNYNTLLGSQTKVISGVSNGTAIGANVVVGCSNCLVLGYNANVGIGTSNPSRMLHLNGLETRLRLESSDSNVWTAIEYKTDAREWHAGAGGSTVPNDVKSKYYIFDATAQQFGMVIDASGSVGIGTTTPSDRLHVAGDVRVGTGTAGCVKDADGTVIAGTCSSDARLKRGITPFANLLDKLARLQPVHFHWRSDEYPERAFGAKQSYGLIAQEVEAVLPELVTADEQGYKAVNYSKLPLLTIQAVKELKAENDALKQTVTQQGQQLNQQQAQIEALKKLACLDHPAAEVCK